MHSGVCIADRDPTYTYPPHPTSLSVSLAYAHIPSSYPPMPTRTKSGKKEFGLGEASRGEETDKHIYTESCLGRLHII